MSKVLYTATVMSHIAAFHQPYMKEMKEHGYEVHVAAKDNLSISGRTIQFANHLENIPFCRSPFSGQNLRAYRQLKSLIDREKYDIIVCNTPVGGVLTRLAARKARKQGTKVIYIAHGFHFYRGAPIKNWVVYYPVEKLLAKISDTVVTIVDEDYRRAKESFNTNVVRIHGIGVDPERFHPVTEEEKTILRYAEMLKAEDFVVLCTGELNENKNQVTLIKAAAKCQSEIPNLRVLLAGTGPMEGSLKELTRSLDLEGVVSFLGYRKDMERLVPMADVIVSCSRREGLGINVLEGMFCEKPVIASENRGHRELIEDGTTGYRFPVGDEEKLAQQLLHAYNLGESRKELGKAGYAKAMPYSLESVMKELRPELIVKGQ